MGVDPALRAGYCHLVTCLFASMISCFIYWSISFSQLNIPQNTPSKVIVSSAWFPACIMPVYWELCALRLQDLGLPNFQSPLEIGKALIGLCPRQFGILEKLFGKVQNGWNALACFFQTTPAVRSDTVIGIAECFIRFIKPS